MAKRYTRVVVRPYRVRKYPFKAKEIVFTVCKTNAVQAVEMLMCYMGYGASQYRIVSADDVSTINAETQRPMKPKEGRGE